MNTTRTTTIWFIYSDKNNNKQEEEEEAVKKQSCSFCSFIYFLPFAWPVWEQRYEVRETETERECERDREIFEKCGKERQTYTLLFSLLFRGFSAIISKCFYFFVNKHTHKHNDNAL